MSTPGRGRRYNIPADAGTAAACPQRAASAGTILPSLAADTVATRAAATTAAPTPSLDAAAALPAASEGAAEIRPAALLPHRTAGATIPLDNSAASKSPAASPGAGECAVLAAAAPAVEAGVPAADAGEAAAPRAPPTVTGITAAPPPAEREDVRAAASCGDAATCAATAAEVVEVLDAALDWHAESAAAETFVAAAAACPPTAAAVSPSAAAAGAPALAAPATTRCCTQSAAALGASGAADGNKSAAANLTAATAAAAESMTHAARLQCETAGLSANSPAHVAQEEILIISDDEATASVATPDTPLAAASPSTPHPRRSPLSLCHLTSSSHNRSSSDSSGSHSGGGSAGHSSSSSTGRSSNGSSSSENRSNPCGGKADSSARCSRYSRSPNSVSFSGHKSSGEEGEVIYEWSEAQQQFVRRFDLERVRAEDVHFSLPDTCFIIEPEERQQRSPLGQLLQQQTPPLPPWLQFFHSYARVETTAALPVACHLAAADASCTAAGASPRVACSVAASASPVPAPAAAVAARGASETRPQQAGEGGQQQQAAASQQQVPVRQLQQRPQHQAVRLYAFPASRESAAAATCDEVSGSTNWTSDSSSEAALPKDVGTQEVMQLWQQVLADVAAYRRWQREKVAATSAASGAAQQGTAALPRGANAAAAADTATAVEPAATRTTAPAHAEEASRVAPGLAVAASGSPLPITEAAESPPAAAPQSSLAATATAAATAAAARPAATTAAAASHTPAEPAAATVEEKVLPWQPRCGQERGQFYAAWARLPAGCSPSPAHARQYWQQLLQDVDAVETLRLTLQRQHQQQPERQALRHTQLQRRHTVPQRQQQQQQEQQQQQQEQQRRQVEQQQRPREQQQRQQQPQEGDGPGQLQIRKRRQEEEEKQQSQQQQQRADGGLHRTGAGVSQSTSNRSTWPAGGGARQQVRPQVTDLGRTLQQKSLLWNNSTATFSSRAPSKAAAVSFESARTAVSRGAFGAPAGATGPSPPATAVPAAAAFGAAAARSSAAAVGPAAFGAGFSSFKASLPAVKRQRLGGSGGGAAEAAATAAAAASGPRRPAAYVPLAERLRPRSLQEFVWHGSLVEHDSRGTLKDLIQTGQLPSLILWGPPGCGKTTLALLAGRALNCFPSAAASASCVAPVAAAASTIGAAAPAARGAAPPSGSFTHMSATACGVNDIKKVVQQAEQLRRTTGQKAVLFLDEIHRFNKAQQDTLLPHVEAGTLILIGATTENPSFEVNRALLSRCRVVKMEPLPEESVRQLLQRAAGREGVNVTDEALDVISRLADGDARRGLNALEEAIARGRVRQEEKSTQPEEVKKDASAAAAEAKASQQLQQHERENKPLLVDISCIADAGVKTHLLYDKMKDSYYDLISALHKSVRGSDAHAAVYYLARMLEAGEDPLRIARRIVRMASEDVGLADPQALGICVAAYEAAHFTGMPECTTALAMAVIYLSHAAKSNAVYLAYNKAKELIHKQPDAPVPLHIRNAPTNLMKQLGYAKNYVYTNQPEATFPDDQCSAFRAQTYLPAALAHTKIVPDHRPQQCRSSSR